MATHKVTVYKDRALVRDEGAIADADVALTGSGVDANAADTVYKVGGTIAESVEIGRATKTVKIKGNLEVEGTTTAPHKHNQIVFPGLTTTGLATGQAAYISAANTATKTDSAVEAKSQALGVYDGVSGELVTHGLVSAAQFTTAGGSPAAGAPVYLAAAADDTNTGAGKFTATKPVAGFVAEAGICVDPANYASAKTAKIRFLPKAVTAA